MQSIPKLFIGLGLTLVVIGVIWYFGGRYLKFGRLPGDISIEKENFKFYAPITTSILLSIGLTALAWLVQWLRR